MIRVNVLVEGQTEETFVNRILQPYFNHDEIYLYPRQIGKPGHRGGIGPYQRGRRDILILLKQQPHAFCTTMFDYYGMPNSWPGRNFADNKPFLEKPGIIEQAMLNDICTELGDGFNRVRLIPYVQMHEFEALLFSNPQALAQELDLVCESEIKNVLSRFQSPEEINDSQQTAPSKRILRWHKSYSKVHDGVLISQRIGLDVMREKCPHFNQWIRKLELLPKG